MKLDMNKMNMNNGDVRYKGGVYMLGDIHNEMKDLYYMIDGMGLRECCVICVGDFGIGSYFPESEDVEGVYGDINNFLRARGIDMYVIRGNHDNPELYNGRHMYSNLKLVRDYYSEVIMGQRFLFIGGAISIDRARRKRSMRNGGDVCYWEGEEFSCRESEIVECDILVTHSISDWQYMSLPFNGTEVVFEMDPMLWQDLERERADIQFVMMKSKCKRSFHGHFHMKHFMQRHGIEMTILDIFEFKRII